jgi:hypothetical protein
VLEKEYMDIPLPLVLIVSVLKSEFVLWGLFPTDNILPESISRSIDITRRSEVLFFSLMEVNKKRKKKENHLRYFLSVDGVQEVRVETISRGNKFATRTCFLAKLFPAVFSPAK